MAVKKQDNPYYTNRLIGRSKEDIICDFAYSLTVASDMSPVYETKKALLELWRKDSYGELLSQSLSEKQLRKYKSRGLLYDDTFVKIASLLKIGTEDKDLLGAIASKVLMDLGVCISRILEDEENSISDGDINWDRIRRDWAPAIAYLRMFFSKEQYEDELKKRGIRLSGAYKDLVDAVFSQNDKICWFINRQNLPDDKQRITKYLHPSDYFSLCMDLTYERLTYIQGRFLFACGTAEYGTFKGYAISSLDDDSTAMRSGYDILLADEMEVSVLNAEKPDINAFAPPEESYFDFWTAKAALKVVYEYSRIGVDILAVIRASALGRNDASSVVKEAFLCYEMMKGESVSFTSKRDKEAVTELIVRLWISRGFEKQYAQLFMQKKQNKDSDASKHKKRADRLQEENELLTRKLAQADRRAASVGKQADASAKQLMAELRALKKEIREKELLLQEKDIEIEEIKRLAEGTAAESDEAGNASEKSIDETTFRAYIQSHRVLVWGLRDETEKKYKEMYPELVFVSSDRRLTKQQLEAYDVLIMATNYTNHGNFWAARDTAKRCGIPMAYLEKTANSPDAFFRALGIVMNSADCLH